MSVFADWLSSVRAGRLSQERLAELARTHDPKCSVYQARITAWEHKRGLPNLRQLRALCLALDLSDEETSAARAIWDAAQLHDEPPAAPLEDAVTVTS